MTDSKQWYYMDEDRFPIVRGPISLEEMGALIERGLVQGHTQVRFGSDGDWYGASSFMLLKRFLEPTPSHARPSLKKLPHIGLAAVILVLVIVYFPRGRAAVLKHDVLPLPELAMISPAGGSRLSVTGIIQYTNRARTENGGFSPLSENGLLDTIASQHADDMLQKQYFAHISPSGEGATDLAQRTGYYYKRLGENIAMGHFQNDEKAVMAWMQSPRHRQNILSEEYSEIGVAVRKGSMKGEQVWIAVQIFGEQAPPFAADPATNRPLTYASTNSNDQRRSECQPPAEPLLDDITKAKAELDALTEQAASLHKELSVDKSSGASGIDGKDLNQKVAKYNELSNEISTRRRVALRLISSYNQSVESYNTCVATRVSLTE